MKRSLKIFALAWLVMVTLMFGPHLWWVAFDKDYYGWPAVTKCRICDKTVWVWQSYSRRPIPVQLDNPDGLLMSCAMTGLMHDACKGSPKPAKVEVELVSEPEYY